MTLIDLANSAIAKGLSQEYTLNMPTDQCGVIPPLPGLYTLGGNIRCFINHPEARYQTARNSP